MSLRSNQFAKVFYFTAVQYPEFGGEAHQVLVTISDSCFNKGYKCISQRTDIIGIENDVSLRLKKDEANQYFEKYCKEDAYDFLKEMYNAYK